MFIALIIAFVLPAAAFATPALNVIGSSGCQIYNEDIAATSSYGVDPTLPVIIAFDDDVSTVTLTTADFTFVDSSNNSVSFTVSTSGMAYNEVALIPDDVLGSSAYYTVGFADDLAGNASFEFKTKTPGGGGGTAILRCAGRIVDDYYTNEQSAPYVPRDQLFQYIFSNAITTYASTNDDAIHLYKFIGSTYTTDIFDTNNWEEVDPSNYTVTVGYSSIRWYLTLQANSLLDANTSYCIYIDDNMRANNGYYLGDEVFEYFMTGTVYDQ